MKLNEIGNGGLQEVYDLAEKKIIENAKDPNTEYKANRKITVELKFKMDENREVINMEYSVKPTLAPVKSNSTNMHLYKDTEGEYNMKEIGNHIPGQEKMNIDNVVSMEREAK